jgi:hypothetical protein
LLEEMNQGPGNDHELNHTHNNGHIHKKITIASEQIKKIIENIREEENIQLNTIEGIKAEILPVIQEAAKNPEFLLLIWKDADEE